MTIRWTKTDTKRAKRMGWVLMQMETRSGWAYYITGCGGRFKSDDEAIDSVKWSYRHLGVNDIRWKTADKALALCAKG